MGGVRGAGGFTVVEVVVAALLLMVVGVGVSVAVTGGTRVEASAKVNAGLSSAARELLEAVRADRSWMEGCRSSDCDLTPEFSSKVSLVDRDLRNAQGVDLQWRIVSLVAHPVDSELDGLKSSTANPDADGVVPDYYSIRATIGPPDEATRMLLGGIKDLSFTSAIDERGNVMRGSLEVVVCKVENQIDDKMSIGDCGTTAGGIEIRMAGCEKIQGGGIGDKRFDACKEAFAPFANQAFSNAPTNIDKPSGTVVLKPVNQAPSLTAVVGGGSAGSPRLVSPGHYLFDDLVVGTYKINIGTPSGYVRWPSHDVPGYGGGIAVEPDVRGRGLIIFRPKPMAQLELVFQRTTTNYTLTNDWKYVKVKDHEKTDEFIGSYIDNNTSEMGPLKLPEPYFSAAGCPLDVPVSQLPAKCTFRIGRAYFPPNMYATVLYDKAGLKPEKNCVTVYRLYSKYVGERYSGTGDVFLMYTSSPIGSGYAYEYRYYCSYRDKHEMYHRWHVKGSPVVNRNVPGATWGAQYWIEGASQIRETASVKTSAQYPFETVRDLADDTEIWSASASSAAICTKGQQADTACQTLTNSSCNSGYSGAVGLSGTESCSNYKQYPYGEAKGPYPSSGRCLDADETLYGMSTDPMRRIAKHGCQVVGMQDVLSGNAGGAQATSRIQMKSIPTGLWTKIQMSDGECLVDIDEDDCEASKIPGSGKLNYSMGIVSKAHDVSESLADRMLFKSEGSGGLWVSPAGFSGCPGAQSLSYFSGSNASNPKCNAYGGYPENANPLSYQLPSVTLRSKGECYWRFDPLTAVSGDWRQRGYQYTYQTSLVPVPRTMARGWWWPKYPASICDACHLYWKQVAPTSSELWYSSQSGCSVVDVAYCATNTYVEIGKHYSTSWAPNQSYKTKTEYWSPCGDYSTSHTASGMPPDRTEFIDGLRCATETPPAYLDGCWGKPPPLPRPLTEWKGNNVDAKKKEPKRLIVSI